MMEPENSTENERNETEPPLKKTCTDSDGGATSLLDMYGEILEENMDKEHQTHKTSAVGQQVNFYPLISKKKKKKSRIRNNIFFTICNIEYKIGFDGLASL